MALLPVSEALARILATARLTGVEIAALREAHGRVTAADIKAKRSQPPFAASAMDGYALRHANLAALPATLEVIGTSAAGHGFKASVKPGQAVRIFTGAPLPKGADTVVIQENTTAADARVIVNEGTALGRNIREAGLDFKAGDTLVPAGTRLRARDVGLLASANAARVKLRRKPRVAIFATGDELRQPGQPARWDQIYSSNSSALCAFAAACGAEVIDLGLIKDDLKATTAAIRKALAFDILVTTGGASVGDHDFVQAALKQAGAKIDFWKIAMRPGKPFMFATKGRLRVLGLPGNPVAALVCAQLFLRPLLAAMLGESQDEAPLMARLGADLPANDLRQDYLRASLRVAPDGTRSATPAPKQDSSMQRTLREAQCLIIRPPHAPAAKTGELCEILLLPEGV